MHTAPDLRLDYLLLGLLALLWGSSYLFIRIAVAEIPPLTLIAGRVFGAALLLLVLLRLGRQRLPRAPRLWAMLALQSVFNSVGAWTVLAWGEQYTGAGLASVLNSTSPVFVFLLTAVLTHHEPLGARRLSGAGFGLLGVVLTLGTEALSGAGDRLAGQAACLLGAVLYAAAAIYGRRFASIGATATAAGTMICASLALVPAALLVDHPWTLQPGPRALAAALALSLLCTGVALVIYFRLVRTLGSLGVASQSYLRAAIGVLLGISFGGESFSPPVALGLAVTLLGVVLMNWPARRAAAQTGIKAAATRRPSDRSTL